LIVAARLQVGEVDETQPVGGDERVALFRVRLRAGSTRVQTWSVDGQDESRGAHHVYARRVG
jgi:hypothetical protein